MHCVHIQTNSFIIWSYPIQFVIAQHSSCNLIEANQRFIVSLRCFYYFLPNLRTQVCCEPNTDPFISFLSDIPKTLKICFFLLFCTLFPATPKYEQLNHQKEKFQFGMHKVHIIHYTSLYKSTAIPNLLFYKMFESRKI